MNDDVPAPPQLTELETLLLALLEAHPAGLSEHALLKELRQRNALFASFNAREPLSLFRGHFLLFHMFYRLRDRLCRERGDQLVVDPLRIVLKPLAATDNFAVNNSRPLIETDALRAWYSDLRRWTTITSVEVVTLLRQFAMVRHANSQRRSALAELGLQDPVDAAAIKQRYRRLAMQHHPDRGGDSAQLCRINAALAVLAVGFRPVIPTSD